MRDVEYDRFGPWILEVSDIDPMPPVFSPYVIEEEQALLILKIPRPMERRDLSPGEHMYDYLVSLFDDRIEILVRDADEAVRFKLLYKNIVALKHSEDLLDGHMVIYTPEIAYDLPYSTVSVDLIRQVLDIIRERYTSSGEDYPPFSTGDDGIRNPEELSFLFTGLADSRQRSAEAGTLFALQTEQKMLDIDESFFRRMFYGTVDKRLLESLHYISNRELEIISRGRSWAYRWQAVYGRETLFLPLDHLARVDEDENVRNHGTSVLRLLTRASQHSYIFTEGNPAMERYQTIVLRGKKTEQ